MLQRDIAIHIVFPFTVVTSLRHQHQRIHRRTAVHTERAVRIVGRITPRSKVTSHQSGKDTERTRLSRIRQIRLVHFRKDGVGIDLHQKVLRNLNVEVGTQVVTLQIIVVIKILRFRDILQQASLIGIAERNEILHLFSTSLHVHIVLLHQRSLLVHQILPVHIRIKIGRIACTVMFQRLVAVKRIGQLSHILVIHIHFLDQLQALI